MPALLRALRRLADQLAGASWVLALTLLVGWGGRASAQTPAAVTAAPAGALVVPAGTVRDGGLTLLTGDLEVRGLVRGDVLLGTGTLVVAPGGRVTGSARSLLGRVRLAGGRVDGGVRAGLRSSVADQPAGPYDAWAATRVVLAWFGVLLVLGLGLLAGAGAQLDAVAAALEAAPGRALLAGLAGQLALAPALALLSAALALTVVGLLAVPLAVVLFVLAAAGLLTLGFLASAFVLGRWVGGGTRAPGRARATAVRAESLRALGLGLGVVLVVWVAAALLGGGAAGLLVRSAAVALTWVAVTAGFGAALRSRAGTRTGRPAAAATATDRGGVPVWQTPTPVAGVVAARRPTMPGAARPTAGSAAE